MEKQNTLAPQNKQSLLDPLHINWEVRLRNKTFLVTAASGLLLVAKQVAEMNGVTLPTEELSTWVDAGLSLLVALGVVIDPTTAGVADSVRAMGYSKPH